MDYTCDTFTFFYFRFDSENYYVNVFIVRTGRCVVPGREIRNRWMLQYDKATKKRTAKKNKTQIRCWGYITNLCIVLNVYTTACFQFGLFLCAAFLKDFERWIARGGYSRCLSIAGINATRSLHIEFDAQLSLSVWPLNRKKLEIFIYIYNSGSIWSWSYIQGSLWLKTTWYFFFSSVFKTWKKESGRAISSLWYRQGLSK